MPSNSLFLAMMHLSKKLFVYAQEKVLRNLCALFDTGRTKYFSSYLRRKTIWRFAKPPFGTRLTTWKDG